MSTFEAANKKVHPVEGQWHHPILTAHGFVAETREATGFVRSYTYRHPNGRIIVAVTGSRSDYWREPALNKGGYWNDLEAYLGESQAST